jgi:hypothetical protein
MGHSVHEGCKYRDLGPPGCRSHESRRVNYGDGFDGIQTQEQLCWRGLAVIVNARPVLSAVNRRGTRTLQTCRCLTVTEMWSVVYGNCVSY